MHFRRRFAIFFQTTVRRHSFLPFLVRLVPPYIESLEPYKAGKPIAELQKELEALFESQNRSAVNDATSIPATFLRVTVSV